jgi:hypothetical protein
LFRPENKKLKQTQFTTMDPTRQPSAEGVNEFPMSPNVEKVKKYGDF